VKLYVILSGLLKHMQKRNMGSRINGKVYIVQDLDPGMYTFEDVLTLANQGQVTLTRL